MTILLWFRKNARFPERPGTIQVRVSVDKVATNFSSGVYCLAADWDSARQQVRGRTDAVRVANQRLQQLTDGLREAFNVLERDGAYITPQRVVARYQQPQQRRPPLLELATGPWLAGRAAQVEAGQIQASTHYADRVRVGLLQEWLTRTRRLDLRPDEFTAARAEQLLEWLMLTRSRNYALKVLDSMASLLRWCVRHEHCATYPMEGYWARKDAPKTAVFLTPADLVKLWYFEFATPQLRRAADVFLFQCFTGLSWQDAANFRASQHLVPQPGGGLLIRLHRQKTNSLTMVPLFQPARELLARYGGEALPVPPNQTLNRTLKQIGYVCNFSQHLTSHVGRKTAGMIMLQDGVPMTIVSAALGHRSVAITQSVYAQVLPDTMHAELAKVYGVETLGLARQRVPFLREFSERLQAAA